VGVIINLADFLLAYVAFFNSLIVNFVVYSDTTDWLLRYDRRD